MTKKSGVIQKSKNAEVVSEALVENTEQIGIQEETPAAPTDEQEPAKTENQENSPALNDHLAEQMKKDMMSMKETHHKRLVDEVKRKRIPAYSPPLIRKWESLPSFVATLKTTIVDQIDQKDVIIPTEIKFSKESESKVAEISWEGHVFGHMHVGPFSYEKEIVKRRTGDKIKIEVTHEGGPHFKPVQLTKKEREEKFYSHVSPWKRKGPANLAVKFIFEKLMTTDLTAEPMDSDPEGRLVFVFEDNVKTKVSEME